MWKVFFFQAEDGIRDLYVTGVQTCALPISGPVQARRRAAGSTSPQASSPRLPRRPRSEERRVGKECRSRWSPHHAKDNFWYATADTRGVLQRGGSRKPTTSHGCPADGESRQ